MDHVGFDPTGTVGIAATGYAVWRTIDGGLTWREAGQPFVDFTEAQLRVASVGAGIYRSTDNGSTWTRNGWPGRYLLGIRAHGPLVRAVGENGLVLQSDDGGASWREGPDVGFGQIWGIDFSAAGTAAYAVGSGGVVARLPPH